MSPTKDTTLTGLALAQEIAQSKFQIGFTRCKGGEYSTPGSLPLAEADALTDALATVEGIELGWSRDSDDQERAWVSVYPVKKPTALRYTLHVYITVPLDSDGGQPDYSGPDLERFVVKALSRAGLNVDAEVMSSDTVEE